VKGAEMNREVCGQCGLPLAFDAELKRLYAEIEALKQKRSEVIEMCALICEEEAGELPHHRWEWADGVYDGAMNCAESIRALK
jgi:hypothetical protein